jgi:3D (Asp-Asp-Asp) domain-containing protein
MDKMNRRYQRRIDVYFGLDVRAARDFGRRKTRIYWR